MNRVIVIGSGLAGYTVARSLRRLDKNVALTIVTADQGEFYSKPMLSEAFSLGKSPDALAYKTAEQMAAQLDAQILTGRHVVQIRAAEHLIDLDDRHIRYSKLVLALGAEAIRPPFGGDGAADVLCINDLRDYGRFRATVDGRKRVLIVGAGLIGCEFANDLAGAGFHVDVVDIASQPLGRLLPPASGAMVARRLDKLGVRWHLGTSVRTIERAGYMYRIHLASGVIIDTDVMLCAIGVQPRTALARAAGLRIGRGITVDRLLRTSDQDIYALGDCAEVAGLLLPFTAPIIHCAKALLSAWSDTSIELRYPAMPVVVKIPACPTVVAPPPMDSGGHWQVSVSADGVRALCLDESGAMLGFALNGNAVHDHKMLTPQLPAWL